MLNRKHILAALAALSLLSTLLVGVAQAQVIFPTGVDCSGTIPSGGTATLIAAVPAGQTRHGFMVQNLGTHAMAISEIVTNPATLTKQSWTLNAGTASTAGGSYTSPPTYASSNAITIVGTSSDAFTCVWW